MKIEIEKKSESEMSFVLTGASLAFANLLRRYAIAEIPTFAIEDVVIYENSSSFIDEYIAHRLGLIPLKTPAKSKPGDEVAFTLDAEGDGTVYSKSLKSTDKSVVPVSDRIPLIKLNDGKRIRLEAKAVVGTAKSHGKFQPGITSYGYEKEGEFRFMIESFAQMTAPEILKRALEQIEEHASDIEKKLENEA